MPGGKSYGPASEQAEINVPLDRLFPRSISRQFTALITKIITIKRKYTHKPKTNQISSVAEMAHNVTRVEKMGFRNWFRVMS